MNSNYKFLVTIFLIICLIFLYNTYIKKLIILSKYEYTHTSINNVINIYNNKIKNNKYKLTENIIFFFSIDYKTMPKYYKKSFEMYKYYCNLHGYKFIVINHSEDQNKISPYWNRVSDLVNLSNQYKENPNTIFIYIDVDTCINPKYSNITIDNFLNSIDYIENKTSDIYIGNDLNNSVNAGVIIIRNTDWSKQFLNLWWSKYDPENWNLKNGKWICKQDGKICDWAKNGYEEGSFSLIYDNNEINSKYHINILHYSLLSNHLTYDDGFIFHFYIRSSYYKSMQINKYYNKY